MLARPGVARVVAPQRPVPGVDRALLLIHPLGHVDPVGDAVAVRDHERRPVPRVRLCERLHGLDVVRPERDLGDVDVPVGGGDLAEVLLARLLAARRVLRDGAARRGLRGLAAGVRVDLGVEHQHVDVLAGGEHVVETAEADVVGPAVPADEPHARLHQGARDRLEPAGTGVDDGHEPLTEDGEALALRGDLGLGLLRRPEQVGREIGCELRDERLCLRALRVEGEPHPQTELGVVLEQRVRPGRAAPVRVGRPRGGRQVAAVDRRAAGGVRDEQPVAEQLGEDLQVRRLAAPLAGPRVLEQRLERLRALDGRRLDERAVELGDREEEVVALPLDRQVVGLRLEVDRLVAHLLLGVRRTRLDADPAARAVVRRDLDRHLHPGQVPIAPVLGEEPVAALPRAPRAGRPSCGSPRAGRRARTSRSRCRSTDPRSGCRARSSASRRGWCRSGTSRRPGARSRAARRPGPSSIVAVTSRTNAGSPSSARRSVAAPAVTAPGTSTSCRPSSARSIASRLRATTTSPRFPYAFSSRP